MIPSVVGSCVADKIETLCLFISPSHILAVGLCTVPSWSSTTIEQEATCPPDEAIGTIAPVLREEECEPGPSGPWSYYAWIQGTSMATPNAAGVAALIISQYGDFTPDNSQKLHMPPQAVESVLQITANNQPCPEPNTVVYPLNPRPPGTFEGTATCKGDAGGYTSFYGKGIVDALKAVTEYQNH